jgi:FKBP-type peptidyl-prolyl cis-trans isomerase (trigger factor)
MKFQHTAITGLLLLEITAVRGFQAPILLAPANGVFVGRSQRHHRQHDLRRASFSSFSHITSSSNTRRAATASSSSAAAAAVPPPSVTVEHLDNSAVLVHIPVPGKATQAAYDKVCRELSKDIQIPGFRKGSRLPPQVLENSMASKPGGRNALKIQAIKELVGQLVEPTMKEQALDPIGQVTLKISPEDLAETFVPGQELMLDVQCDVWPEIRWKESSSSDQKKQQPYVGLKASYKRKPFNQVKLDKATMDLRERYATLEPINDPSHALQMGDACTVNMVGYMADANGQKGTPLPNAASGDNVQVLMGTGRYMEGLVEGLVGAKPGETVTVAVNFPAVRFGCVLFSRVSHSNAHAQTAPCPCR